MSDLLCDKCGWPVPASNSVARWQIKFGSSNDQMAAAIAIIDRHLYPVTGEHSCEGSPSRVEMLPGLVGHKNQVDTSNW